MTDRRIPTRAGGFLMMHGGTGAAENAGGQCKR